MRKRLLSLFCALSLLLTLLPTSVFAVENGAEGTTPQTKDTEVVTTAPEKTELVSLTADELDDPYEGLSGDDLLMGYLYSISGLDDEGPATYGLNKPDLTGAAAQVYTELVNKIKAVANGTETNTKFTVEVSLGSGETLSDVSNQLKNVKDKLLLEKPYDLYWFDKAAGVVMGNDGQKSIIFYMSVSKDYRSSSDPGEDIKVNLQQPDGSLKEDTRKYYLTTDKNLTARGARAVTEAKSVVGNTNLTGKNDYERLKAYADYIATNAEYDHDAAGGNNNTSYGDPWQLINVFDRTEGEAGKVVCEGYAKAFQYLFDLSVQEKKFADNNMQCYLVTGYTPNSADATVTQKDGHMWNIVRMKNADGVDYQNYLVDVTNYDSGAKNLFLWGGTGSPDTEYSATYSEGGSTWNVYYTYKTPEGTLDYGVYDPNTDLKLAGAPYTPSEVQPSITITGADSIGYTGSAVTAGEAGDTPTFTYTYVKGNGEGAPDSVTFDVEWQKKEDSGTYTKVEDATLNATTGPTNVGEYKLVVTATVEGKEKATAEKEFKITPKELKNVTVTLGTTTEFTYDGTEKTVSVSGVTSTDASGATLTYDTTDNSTLKATNAGEYTVTVTLKGNYSGTGTGNWTINRATPAEENFTITKPGEAIPYDGQEHPVAKPAFKVDSGKTGMGEVTVKYKVNGSDGEATTKAPTDAGTDAVTFDVAEGANYNEKAGLTIGDLTISKGTLTEGENKATTIRYSDAEEKSYNATFFGFTEAGTFAAKGPATDEKSVLATDYPIYGAEVKVKLKDGITSVEDPAQTVTIPMTFTPDGGNYEPVDVTLTITLKDKDTNNTTMTVTQENFEYGSKEVNPQVNMPAGVTGEVKYTYKERDKADASESGTAPTDAGKYTVIATLDTENTVYTASADFEITRKSIAGATVMLKKDDASQATTTLELPYTGVQQTVKVGSVTLGDKNLGTGDYTVDTNVNGTNAGQYTVTVTGKGNYTGTAQVTWKITRAELTVTQITPTVRAYEKGNQSVEVAVTFGGTQNNDSLTKGTDYTATGMMADDKAGKEKPVTFTVALKPDGTVSKNYVLKALTDEQTNGTVKINPAKTPAAPTGLTGIRGQKLATVNLPAGWSWVDRDTEMLEAGENKTFKANYTDAQGNYEAASNVDVTVAVKDKVDVSEKITFTDGTLTYNGKGQKYEEATIEIPSPATDKWTYTYAVKEAGNLNDDNLPSTAGTYTVTAKYEDDSCIGTKTVTLTINKAKPTGEPKYDLIKEDGKTLANANLSANDITPAGKIVWMENDATLSGDTKVVANKEYKWVFTPNDTVNYEPLSGTVVLYTKSAPVTPSQPGGGSISGSGTVKTDTVTNPDGSVTKTETKRDGTVIETTTGKDGSVSKTTTNPNGSSVTETKAADGSKGTVKTDERGLTTAQTTLSSKAIETAKRNGEPVKAPVEVNATRDSSTAPTVKIELPRNSGDTNVEIPVTNVKPGTVAVLVHPDGTEEIVKNSRPTEDGIQLTVNGGATVKIMDNSKDFIDTRAHWAKDAIDFVSARGLVDGMNAVSYAPDASTTRAQLWTILARQNDADLSGGTNWYEKAQLWAKDKGVSDGANPNAAINRAQMVTMLWRTMGQPAAASGASFADVPADSYYAQAVAWAIENGITTGVGGGRFDPNGACTRGQIATFLYRYMK